MQNIRVVALGGLSESGRNCYCIEIDDDIFVVECGLKYPTVTTPGVDYLIPNFDYLRANSSRVKAIIVTHAHDTTYGALPYLLNLMNVPVYASATTITMIRMDYSKRFRRFGTYHFVTVTPSSTVQIAGHTFDFFQTTHSMPNTFGFALHTDAGNIVYSSDFMSDYSHIGNYSFDMPRMCKIASSAPTLLLMCESEGAQLSGTASPKHRITPLITPALESQTGALYIALYTANFYNIQEVINAAAKFGKTVIFANHQLAEYLPAFNASGDLIVPQGHYAKLEDIESVPADKRVIILTGSGLELFKSIKDLAAGTKRNQGLSLGPTDTFIMACPSVPQIEVQHTEALDAVFTTGCNCLNITRRDIASMHAQQEDIKMMITLFRPRYYMPIIGEYRQLMANAMTAVSMGSTLNHRNVFVYDNGMVVKFDGKGDFVAQPEKVVTDDVVIDGNTIATVPGDVLEERASMAKDGVLLIMSLVSIREKKQLSKPDVQMRGFIYLKDTTSLVDKIDQIFSTTIDSLLTHSPEEGTGKRVVSFYDIQRKVANKVQRFLQKETDKTPLVICVIRNADEAERSQQQRAQANRTRSQRPFHPRNPSFNRPVRPRSSEAVKEEKPVGFDLPLPRAPMAPTDEGGEKK